VTSGGVQKWFTAPKAGKWGMFGVAVKP
jgi:hypothetical protein